MHKIFFYDPAKLFFEVIKAFGTDPAIFVLGAIALMEIVGMFTEFRPAKLAVVVIPDISAEWGVNERYTRQVFFLSSTAPVVFINHGSTPHL